MMGNRFGCEDIYLSDSEDSDSNSMSEAQWSLMEKGGVIEGALIELSHEHQLSVAEEIRARISSFGADLSNEKAKLTNALSRAEKNKEARRDLDRLRDLQYQRQMLEAADVALAESQRKAAEALTASQGAVSKESGFKRLNKAPDGNILKVAESALKMEESRLQKYNEVVGKGFASGISQAGYANG